MGKAKLVMAFGSFDLLHPGHLLYLSKAKRLGDQLIVVVARDSSIVALKNRKPVLGERARLEVVGALRMVNRAVLGNRLSGPTDMYEVMRRYKPDVIAFGYDQRIDIDGLRQWLKRNGLNPRIVLIKAGKNIGLFKSSKLRSKLLS